MLFSISEGGDGIKQETWGNGHLWKVNLHCLCNKVPLRNENINEFAEEGVFVFKVLHKWFITQQPDLGCFCLLFMEGLDLGACGTECHLAELLLLIHDFC